MELPNQYLRYTDIRHMDLRLASACSVILNTKVRKDDITAYSCMCSGRSCYDCEMSAAEAGAVLNDGRCPSCGNVVYGGLAYNNGVVCLACGLIMSICRSMYSPQVISGAAKLPAGLFVLDLRDEDDGDAI